jgi:PII-like signaling protein
MIPEGKLVRIFIGESDTWEGVPLYHALVETAQRLGMAGATVLRGIEGYGASSVVHTTRLLRLSEDLPVVVELVDRADQVGRFLEEIDGMISEGLVTVENVEVRMYRSRNPQ